MSDRGKMWLLLAISLVMVTLFLGKGLTLDNYQYFLSRRIPKVLAMVLAGVAISQASLLFQTVTHNRILTPGILGFDSLYLLVQVIIVVVFGGLSQYVLNAYLNFSLSVVAMVLFSMALFGFYFRGKEKNLITLLLVGLIIGQLFSNVASFFVLIMDPNDYATVQASMFASFNNIDTQLVYFTAPILLIASLLMYRMHAVMDVFWLDKDNATSLGVNVRQVTKQVLMLSAVLIAVATALIGPILFFGLLVTNLAREMFHTYRHAKLLPGCAILGVTLLLAGQWLVENVLTFQTTLSVIINFVGGIYFMSMLLRNRIV
ncbi:iron chelate uptake ABC transporter family permease subunit [Vibrio vulnificus]|uniref:Ferric vibriobactin, enterobactin transport system, permease protein VctG n=1 Tax=Vibrio vulnificus TaxID=672 RepID=A0AAN1PSF8_VIBVL|nr:iron chelate uptake ABC transporter family permease subunit [Vibrio vulnificus]ASC59148.1 Ferric vibriobactin, enterobactin transport system, permease protein VctG [Vibrio vulnificus]AUJ37280.1 ABC transporter permease [Vibrio vulnificus]AXX61905.1 Ferric vibriobactin, enterobactin transport system, permease protein VctG [Vibrio vulnificus]EHU9449051.1 iron chelate uptake ABC transporter family permease subunit [Vibrio vulnificus]ELH3005058.1 iron chelate uptake ABC transporter family perme